MKKYRVFISCIPEESIIICAKIYQIDNNKIIFLNAGNEIKAIFSLDYITGFTEVEDET